MSLWITCENIELLNASGVGGSDVESEWWCKQQRFQDDQKGRNEYLENFRSEEAVQIVKKFLSFSEKNRDDTGEI